MGVRRKGGRDFRPESVVPEPAGEAPGGSGTCSQTLHEKTPGFTGCPGGKYGVRILCSPAHPLAVHGEVRSSHSLLEDLEQEKHRSFAEILVLPAIHTSTQELPLKGVAAKLERGLRFLHVPNVAH